MTQYAKLEPAFDSVATCNDAVVSIALFIIIVMVGLIALHAIGKQAIEVRLPEENDEEEN